MILCLQFYCFLWYWIKGDISASRNFIHNTFPFPKFWSIKCRCSKLNPIYSVIFSPDLNPISPENVSFRLILTHFPLILTHFPSICIPNHLRMFQFDWFYFIFGWFYFIFRQFEIKIRLKCFISTASTSFSTDCRFK